MMETGLLAKKKETTESESEVDGSEVSSGYGTLTFDDWMELGLASSPEENDEYWRRRRAWRTPDQDPEAKILTFLIH